MNLAIEDDENENGGNEVDEQKLGAIFGFFWFTLLLDYRFCE